MANYLLAWNPNRWQWDDLADLVVAFNRGKVRPVRWSCSRNKKIAAGDHVWFIRLGKDPRGIFAHGTVVTPSYEDVHWDDATKTSLYVQCEFDSVVHPETDHIIPRARLDDKPFDSMHWDTQSSGIHISDDVANALHEEWSRLIDGDSF